MKSFQVKMKVNTAVMAATGRVNGMMIRHHVSSQPHPSSRAASNNASGSCAMNWRYMKM